jgi:hypothetical protein
MAWRRKIEGYFSAEKDGTVLELDLWKSKASMLEGLSDD